VEDYRFIYRMKAQNLALKYQEMRLKHSVVFFFMAD